MSAPNDALREARLEDAVVRLAAQSDWPGVIRLVEAWAGEGSPTARARLLQGRAFLDLRLMDRALMRAREASEALPDDPASLRFLAEVYLERGWPLRARKPLEALRERGVPDLDALWARAHADPPRPENGAREIEAQGDPAELLALAEAFLATGGFLRGTGILERLRRSGHESRRVQDLLWGIAGDFSTGAPSLAAVLGGGPVFLPVSATSEFPDDAEHTEAVRVGVAAPGDVTLDEPVEDSAFPVLFKSGMLAPAEEGDTSETTQASGVAAPALHVVSGGSAADTQIMQVVGEADGPLHRRRDDAEREPFDLRQWQSDMGVRPSDSDVSDVPGAEEDDENVVLVERSAPPAEAPRVYSKPIEVVEKHPAPPPVAPAPPVARGTPLPTRGILWILVSLFLGGMLLGGVLLFSGWGGRASSRQVRAELLHALAGGDYQALLEAEGRLEVRGSAPAALAALAEVRLVLWSEFNGDPTRLDAVRAFLAAPGSVELRRLAMLRAAAAIAHGDASGARAAMGREVPADDEERLLLARIEEATGDLEGAAAALSTLSAPDAPRYRLARARVSALSGHLPEAQRDIEAVLRARPDHFGARLLQAEWRQGTPSERVAAAEVFLQGYESRGLPPRYEARAHLLRARGYDAVGLAERAREAVAAGLARDGANPELLYLDAAEVADERRLADAAGILSRVVAARRGDPVVRAAWVTLLLDLDRVEEAAAAIDGLEGPMVPVLRVLVSTWGRGEPPAVGLEPPERATPLGAWAAALLAVQERDPNAYERVQTASTALAESEDPFTRRLAPRARALRASLAPVTDADRLANEVRTAFPADPVVHLYLGRWHESAGRRALAAQHFDRAAQLGNELGLALYEKGRFYHDAGDDIDRSGAAWRAYVALAPTGPRAHRVKEALGLR